MNTIEQWKPVKGLEGQYEVSSLGRVKQLNSGKITEGHYNAFNDCLYFCLYDRISKKQVMKQAHRLIAENFLPNPTNLPFVNHINENRKDNRVENLEWCTSSYNLTAGNVPQKISRNSGRNKPVAMYDKEGNLLQEFYNISEASRVLGVFRGSVRKACTGQLKTLRGKIFRFVEVRPDCGSNKAESRSFDVFPTGDSHYTEKMMKYKRKPFVLGYDTAVKDAIAWITENAPDHLDGFIGAMGKGETIL